MNQFNGIPQEARSLLGVQYFGVLSTISHKVDGYPFGSVVPYSLNRNGEPVILISDIAEHTKNIVADARVSLTVLEHGVDRGTVPDGSRLERSTEVPELQTDVEVGAEVPVVGGEGVHRAGVVEDQQCA